MTIPEVWRVVDSTAQRQRRFRAHRKGDHSLCRPESNCVGKEQAEMRDAIATGAPAATKPRNSRRGNDGESTGFGPRGRAFREAAADIGPLYSALVDEAARMIDRLDRLDTAIESKGTWLRFDVDDGGTVIVQVDSVLAEARQQAATLKALIETIAKAMPVAEGKPQAKAGALLELADRIAAKRAAAGA